MPGAPAQLIRTPECPRCGYDQSGLAATWERSCPLHGVCAECGYAFDWSHVFHPHRAPVRWLYEHGPWWSLRGVFITLAMLVWPRAFWRRVQPHHEARPWRILRWYALVWVVLAVAAIASQEASRYAERLALIRIGWSPPRFCSRGPGVPQPVTLSMLPTFFWDDLHAFLLSPELWNRMGFGLLLLGFPSLAFLCMPSERRGCPIRRTHTLRAALYAFTPLLFLWCLHWSWSMTESVVRLVHAIRVKPGGGYGAGVPWRIRSGWEYWFAPLVTGAALFLWPLLYWFAALKHGLHLPRPRRAFSLIAAVILTPPLLWVVTSLAAGHWIFF